MSNYRDYDLRDAYNNTQEQLAAFDLSKVTEATGYHFDNAGDMIEYAKRCIDYFTFHNKNLTKEQYYKIDDLKHILHSLLF